MPGSVVPLANAIFLFHCANLTFNFHLVPRRATSTKFDEKMSLKNQKGGKTNIAKKRIDLSEEAVRGGLM